MTKMKWLPVVVMCIVALAAIPAFADQEKVQTIDDLSAAFEHMTGKVAPAVVHIRVTSIGPAAGVSPTAESLIGRRRSGGSGVILDPNGYIITNAHVVDGARRVQVILQPPRPESGPGQSTVKAEGERMGAQIIGIDRETDLAVLKVQRKGLPYLELADSDEIRQGQIVFAFGSPFGLENTVTMGIVSNTSRQLRPEDPMIYVQTDATINPGNSGGPLVDTTGRVVGINTLIFSHAGGSEGIGFAAPSNIVQNIFNQFKANGRVRRGHVGVHAQTITPTMSKGLALERDWGVIIGDVYPDGPGDKAGLQIGDIIVSLDGKLMENGRQFEVNLYRRAVGDKVDLEVLRGGKTSHIKVAVDERQDDTTQFSDLVHPEKNLIPKLGILALELNNTTARMLPPLRIQSGCIVAALSAAAPLGANGLLPGDVIHNINGTSVKDLGTLRSMVDKIATGEAVVCQVERGGQLLFVSFEMDV